MKIRVQFEERNEQFKLRLNEEREQFTAEFESLYLANAVPVDDYDGSYRITPKVQAQRLDTEGKHMKEDLLVLAIPYSEVSNTAGGNTVHIGSGV